VKTRPAVVVVVPFRGSGAELERLAERLSTLALRLGDTVTVADNRATAVDAQRGALRTSPPASGRPPTTPAVAGPPPAARHGSCSSTPTCSPPLTCSTATSRLRPTNAPGLALWSARRAAHGLAAAARGDRDEALLGMLDGPAVWAFELGRLVPNRPAPRLLARR